MASNLRTSVAPRALPWIHQFRIWLALRWVRTKRFFALRWIDIEKWFGEHGDKLLFAAYILGLFAFALGLIVVITLAFMTVWNQILVPWLHAPVINFWMSWLIMMVLSLMLGNIGRSRRKES